MPVATGFIANRPAYDAWRQPTAFGGDSIFDAAHTLGMTTALVGQPDFHALHLGSATIDVTVPTDAAGAAAAVGDLLAQHPHLLAVVALGAPRSGDHHAAGAVADLGTLASAVSAIASAASGALIAVTSRGATAIDDPMADAYGAGTSRHVPLILIGPNVRAGAVSGQPATPADLPGDDPVRPRRAGRERSRERHLGARDAGERRAPPDAGHRDRGARAGARVQCRGVAVGAVSDR